MWRHCHINRWQFVLVWVLGLIITITLMDHLTLLEIKYAYEFLCPIKCNRIMRFGVAKTCYWLYTIKHRYLSETCYNACDNLNFTTLILRLSFYWATTKTKGYFSTWSSNLGLRDSILFRARILIVYGCFLFTVRHTDCDDWCSTTWERYTRISAVYGSSIQNTGASGLCHCLR